MGVLGWDHFGPWRSCAQSVSVFGSTSNLLHMPFCGLLRSMDYVVYGCLGEIFSVLWRSCAQICECFWVPPPIYCCMPFCPPFCSPPWLGARPMYHLWSSVPMDDL